MKLNPHKLGLSLAGSVGAAYIVIAAFALLLPIIAQFIPNPMGNVELSAIYNQYYSMGLMLVQLMLFCWNLFVYVIAAYLFGFVFAHIYDRM